MNNYAYMSFNFGPTLLEWMEYAQPEVYRQIIEADEESRKHFAGHGSAMAQVYNHAIMPLLNRRDKITQVRWGIHDFEKRFRRAPEGMWLAEAAVDLETLDILAEHGIKFTVLAPRQAHRIRPPGSEDWQDVTGERIDPTRVYVQQLASGRSIALFFYDGPISRGVAFEGLLSRGENLADRLLGAFNDTRDWPQLVHIATDGETFGHHHHLGEMALSYAMHTIEANNQAKLINYGEYLEKFPPSWQVEIHENSSWSCVHGIERWRANCGCNNGMHGGWNQEWRQPLKEAQDWLRDALAPLYERKMAPLLRDPWAARNDYLDVIHDRSPENIQAFLDTHARRPLKDEEIITVLKALEIQRHALLMYTSCGWFFDEISGIETVQVIQYAARCNQLARQIWGQDFAPQYLQILERAISNIPANHDGRWIYENFVRPAKVDLPKVGAHYAVSSLFENYPERARIYCFTAERQDYQTWTSGRERLIIGRARVVSEITWEHADLSFAVMHLGDQSISGGVRLYQGEEAYQQLIEAGAMAFKNVDLPEVIRFLDSFFESSTYSLRSLFKDEQRKVIGEVLHSSLEAAETAYMQIYNQNVQLMRFLAGLWMPLPEAFEKAAEFALTSSLRRAFAEEELDLERIGSLLAESRAGNVTLGADGLEYIVRQRLEKMAQQFQQDPANLERLQKLAATMDVVRTMPFEVNLHRAQNIYYAMRQSACLKFMNLHNEEGDEAQVWLTNFVALGQKLGVEVPEIQQLAVSDAP